MAAGQTRSLGVEPLPVDSVDIEPPFCPHGPTLLFERYYADKSPRKFFACSVHRDRKGCSFFHWADEKISEDKRHKWTVVFRQSQPDLNQSKFHSSLPSEDRHYCFNCSLLFDSSELNVHATHDTKDNVSDVDISQPTKLLCPVDNRKSQAQFYFSDSSLQLFVSELKRLGFSRVLCVGTPRLHEVLSRSGTITESLLLDIDHRYAQFYSPDQFQRFNMFTSFFYEDSGAETCKRFLSSSSRKEEVAIVVDPPFGGLAKVLATGLNSLWQMAGKELTTFLVFPYFMESHVRSAMPSLQMMDYQVTYDNHKHFSSHSKGSKPSPVRIYTNLPAPGMELPVAEGYRLCVPCKRFVAKGNDHCIKCDSCTSKDGRKYHHCDLCAECVKTGRVHCPTCNKCELPNHPCGAVRSTTGCHVCGSLEHKRRDCPNKEVTTQTKPRKRKLTSDRSALTTKAKKHKQ